MFIIKIIRYENVCVCLLFWAPKLNCIALQSIIVRRRNVANKPVGNCISWEKFQRSHKYLCTFICHFVQTIGKYSLLCGARLNIFACDSGPPTDYATHFASKCMAESSEYIPIKLILPLCKLYDQTDIFIKFYWYSPKSESVSTRMLSGGIKSAIDATFRMKVHVQWPICREYTGIVATMHILLWFKSWAFFYTFDSAKNDLDVTIHCADRQNDQIRIWTELISTVYISRSSTIHPKKKCTMYGKHILLNKQTDKLVDFIATTD